MFCSMLTAPQLQFNWLPVLPQFLVQIKNLSPGVPSISERGKGVKGEFNIIYVEGLMDVAPRKLTDRVKHKVTLVQSGPVWSVI